VTLTALHARLESLICLICIPPPWHEVAIYEERKTEKVIATTILFARMPQYCSDWFYIAGLVQQALTCFITNLRTT
jgi:hypothetical protein